MAWQAEIAEVAETKPESLPVLRFDSLTSRPLSACLGDMTIYPAAARLAVFDG